MKKPMCSTCAYWEPDDEEAKRGECRRKAPQDTASSYANWGQTGDDDFCGEHHLFKAWLMGQVETNLLETKELMSNAGEIGRRAREEEQDEPA